MLFLLRMLLNYVRRMLLPHVTDYIELNQNNGIEMIMESWKTCRIYCMFVLLKNVSLKKIRTGKNSPRFFFCYILEFENFAKVRNP